MAMFEAETWLTPVRRRRGVLSAASNGPWYRREPLDVGDGRFPFSHISIAAFSFGAITHSLLLSIHTQPTAGPFRRSFVESIHSAAFFTAAYLILSRCLRLRYLCCLPQRFRWLWQRRKVSRTSSQVAASRTGRAHTCPECLLRLSTPRLPRPRRRRRPERLMFRQEGAAEPRSPLEPEMALALLRREQALGFPTRLALLRQEVAL